MASSETQRSATDTEHTYARALVDVAERRHDLESVLARAHSGGAGLDPVDIMDCTLALEAAEQRLRLLELAPVRPAL